MGPSYGCCRSFDILADPPGNFKNEMIILIVNRSEPGFVDAG